MLGRRVVLSRVWGSKLMRSAMGFCQFSKFYTMAFPEHSSNPEPSVRVLQLIVPIEGVYPKESVQVLPDT